MKYLRISNIKLNIDSSDSDAIKKAIDLVSPSKVLDSEIIKKSIDARKKTNIIFLYTVLLTVDNYNPKRKSKDVTVLKEKPEYKYNVTKSKDVKYRPIIVGFGPSGMFLSYLLAKSGFKPIIIERGYDVDKRTADVEKFWQDNKLNTESNVQFGEGGAGTFSDGKLNTGIKDKKHRIKYVLDTFVEHGAPNNIKYDAKPHVGTDILKNVIKSMRQTIIENGGTFYFGTKLIDFIQSSDSVIVKTVSDNHDNSFETDFCCLCIGNSARDTFEMLKVNNFQMEAKPFAVGFRVEHKQTDINKDRYGFEDNRIGAAPYKLTYNASNNRSVYSFCMCPGGYVVNASSEPLNTAVNGMSYSKRDGDNANSAIVISVNQNDFNSSDPLAGMHIQRNLEGKAYKEGKGFVPVQTYKDFKNNQSTTSLGTIVPNIKGKYTLANLRNVVSEDFANTFIEAMEYFGTRIQGFNDDNTILSAIESRTSSPVRINRDNHYMTNINYVYAAGEGAGFAGGIISSAVDGIKLFEEYVEQ